MFSKKNVKQEEDLNKENKSNLLKEDTSFIRQFGQADGNNLYAGSEIKQGESFKNSLFFTNTNSHAFGGGGGQGGFTPYQREDSTKFPTFNLGNQDDMFANSRSKPFYQENIIHKIKMENDNPFGIEGGIGLTDIFVNHSNSKPIKAVLPVKKNFNSNSNDFTTVKNSSFNNEKNEDSQQLNLPKEDEEKQKTSRGLRNLSLRVKELVLKLKKTTYKQVAEQLVDDMKQDMEGIEDPVKDEQNIKRRVYDALNVLIATKVLCKKGKEVSAGSYSTYLGKCLKKESWEKFKVVEKEVIRQRDIVEKKRKIFEDYAKKTIATHGLVQRNNKRTTAYDSQKSIDQFFSQGQNNFKEKINFQSQSQTQTLNDNDMFFPFPLIALKFEQSEENMIIKLSQNQKQAKFFCKNTINIYGDMDLLIMLNIHKQFTDLKSKFLTLEMQKSIQSF